jgi:pimeloyl-ACP methyl ester carboxylesterase
VKQRIVTSVSYNGTAYELVGYRHGDPSSPTILLLNGSLFHQRQWDIFRKIALTPLLGDAYSIITFDYGGTGESTGQGIPWHIDRLGDEAKAVVEKHCKDPVHLFGVSKGTIASQSFAAANPELVASHAGYGWFHLGFSKIHRVKNFFGSRLQSFSFLEQYGYAPSTRKEFDDIWKTTYREVLGGTSHANRLVASAVTTLLKPLVYTITAPTPLRTMYDWFKYGVEAMHEGQEWFGQRKEALSKLPTLIMHAERDGTLPYEMAQELSINLSRAELVTLQGGFNHVSPLIMPHHARTLIKHYGAFLKNNTPGFCPGL